MDINLVRSVVTVVSLVTFIAIMVWAYHPGNRKRFDDAGRIPFEGEQGANDK